MGSIWYIIEALFSYTKKQNVYIMATSRQVHRRDPEGEQPPPPTVPPVWYDDDMEGPEWYTQAHNTVHPGSGE